MRSTSKPTFGQRLRTARIRAGYYTAKAVAEEIGVTANTYYRYERDESKPSPYMLARLTEVLKVRAGELEDGDQDTFDPPSADRIANNAMGFAETSAQTFDH